MNDSTDRDRGSTSLTIVLLAPVMLVLMFAGFQAAMWNHTRTEARVVARETAVLVARDNLSEAEAVTLATKTLAADSVLANAKVSFSSTADNVIVTITGAAPGVLRGTSAGVSVTVAVPRNGWVPV